MSRLQSFIRRLSAQVAVLDRACELVAGIPGPVLEIGLGNGRTYDHLRSRLKGREIFAFDRALAAHPACVPDNRHLILGDFADTLPGMGGRMGRAAALAHCDIGSGDEEATARLAAWLGPVLMTLLAPGAVVAADQPLAAPGLAPLPLPPSVAEGRYFLYSAKSTTTGT
jgi:S-adenosyl-L-methionine methyltransferase